MGLKENASAKLNAAYVDAQRTINSTCAHKDFIDFVIDNTHLTYKYVLFTAILAKATDESINTLCLQKKSELPGAYDARTICHNSKSTMTTFTIEKNANLPAYLMAYMEKALEHSYEGEILTLLVAGTYHLMYNEPNATVEVHPVNQSGASGREISDLDIYVDGSLVASNELKDKDYAETDVRHATDKVLSAGGTKMLFIEGPRANAQGDFINNIEHEYLNKNFLLRVISYENLLSSMIGSIDKIDSEEFMHFIIETAQNTKFKDETIAYLMKLADEFFDLNHSKNKDDSTK